MNPLPAGTVQNGVRFQAEGANWLTALKPEPALAEQSAKALLERGARLRGNLRYVRAALAAEVMLMGDARLQDGSLSFEEAEDRLRRLLEFPQAETGAGTDEEVIEAALESSGLRWTRRETTWAVPATEYLVRELHVLSVPEGVRVEALLVQWDEPMGEAAAEALPLFLCAGQAGLRFARCELAERAARIVSLADTAHVETELEHSLRSVAAGCRLLAREAQALLVPEVARAFLDFCRVPPALDE
jgi:hypothetical protein